MIQIAIDSLHQPGVLPLVLTLDTHGVPHRWITWQHACFYYAKGQVAWTLGEHAFTVYGGCNRVTGERSEITASSIIAIKGKAMAMKSFNQVPPLNNRELFHRDRQICAYCADSFASNKLIIDSRISKNCSRVNYSLPCCPEDSDGIICWSKFILLY